MSPEDLARWKALADAPGNVTDEDFGEWVADAPDDGEEGPVACLAEHGHDLRNAIREAVPVLIAEVERLREENAHLREEETESNDASAIADAREEALHAEVERLREELAALVEDAYALYRHSCIDRPSWRAQAVEETTVEEACKRIAQRIRARGAQDSGAGEAAVGPPDSSPGSDSRPPAAGLVTAEEVEAALVPDGTLSGPPGSVPWTGMRIDVRATCSAIAALVAERWAARERLWRRIEAGVSEQRDALNEDNLQLHEREAAVARLVEAVRECPEVNSDEAAHDEDCARVGDDSAACTCWVGRLRAALAAVEEKP